MEVQSMINAIDLSSARDKFSDFDDKAYRQFVFDQCQQQCATVLTIDRVDLQSRYLFNGNWLGLCTRVASSIAYTVEDMYSYVQAMCAQAFIPAGNTLIAGATSGIQLSPNCCVLGVLTDDNLESMCTIAQTLWESGTGVGFDVSQVADPVSVLRRLSAINASIDLRHRPQRGNIATCSCDHPRIMEFISCKDTDPQALYNFNISVSVRRWSEMSVDVLNAVGTSAHRTGDPGMIFLENVNNDGNRVGSLSAGIDDELVTCVPCGEQFMHQYETCNLGALNLNAPVFWNADNTWNRERVSEFVGIAVRMLDNVVDRLQHPCEELADRSHALRRIGLGVMGWADVLSRVGLPYDSAEACAFAEDVARFITAEAEMASARLCRENGRPSGLVDANIAQRNVSLTCVAPTGGITLLTQNFGYGIEPKFTKALCVSAESHIDMQAAWQGGVHNAVSKTVNVSEDTTVERICELYEYAWRNGCKGVTLFRNGCRNMRIQPICVDCEP